MSNRKLLGLLLVALLGVEVISALVGLETGLGVTNWRKYHSLINGTEVHGEVTFKDSQNHNNIRYSYDVKGQTYTGVGQSGFGNEKFKDLRIGSKVIVFYDPADPSVSCLGDPNVLIQPEADVMSVMVFVCSFFPLVFGGILIVIVMVVRQRKSAVGKNIR